MNEIKRSRGTANKRRYCRLSLRGQRRHDRMLLLSMSAFNFESGWNRVFNPVPARENVWW